MPHPIRSVLLALSLSLCTWAAVAAPSASEVEDLACKAGLCQQVDAMQQQMLESLDEVAASGVPGLQADAVQRLRRVASDAYSAKRLRGHLLSELARRLDERDLPALHSWFASAAGQSVTRAEQSGADNEMRSPASPEAAAALRSISAPRKRLLVEILRESHTAEASVDIIINTTLAVRSGLLVAAPDMPQPDTRALRATLESNRPAMIRSFAQVSLPILARSYAGISDDDLASYLKFMQSEPGARFNEVSIRSFESALLMAAAEFGHAIPGSRRGLDI